MLKAISKTCFFIISSFFIANALSHAIISSEILSFIVGNNKIGNETYQALKKSKISSSAESIIIGDSVARPIFSEESENKTKYYNLASNECISLIGQYVIANNALSINKQIKRLYLIYHPDAFLNNLDEPFTYNYFVKPFYTCEYRIFLSVNAINRLKTNEFFFLFGLPISKTLPIFNKIDYNDKKFDDWFGFPKALRQRPYLSEISIEYLKKLEKLCLEKNVTLSVVMAPISKRYDTDFSMLQSQIKANNLNHIFAGYFENKIILDDSYFRDGAHLKKQYLAEVYDMIDAGL
jgi:hypothetical protein